MLSMVRAAALPRTGFAPVGGILAVRGMMMAAAMEKPKRPSTSFILFVNDKRDEYRRKHPHLKVTEVTKKLGEQWARMAESQKIGYTTRYEQARVKYDKEMERYLAQLSPDQIAAEKKEKAILKKARKLKDADKPKRALSAYNFFMKDVRPHMDKSLSLAEQAKILGIRWKTMDDEREKYIRMAAHDKKRYEKEMAAYNAKK